MLLGRPTMINDRHCTVSPPLDCTIPDDLATEPPPVLRDFHDAPSVFCARLVDYKLVSRTLPTGAPR